KIDDFYHREPIARIQWIKILGEKSYQLVSISGDGKVLFWTLENKLAYPTEGVLLVPSTKYHGHGAGKNRFPVMGGTAISFSIDLTTYIVGTEGGGVLKCLTVQSKRKGTVKVGDY